MFGKLVRNLINSFTFSVTTCNNMLVCTRSRLLLLISFLLSLFVNVHERLCSVLLLFSLSSKAKINKVIKNLTT